MQDSTNSDNEAVTNAKNPGNFENDFPLTGVFKVIGGKWKMTLVKAIAAQCPKRFGELRREMENVTQGTLTLQLKELERDKIISREAFAESPPRVEYKLTEIGKTLIPVLDVLEEWWENYGSNGSSKST